MGAFDNAKVVMINNKEVDSIKTNDGGVIYQRPTNIVVTGDSVTLGYNGDQWLDTNGNVIIDWGDGTQSTVNNPTTKLTHNYTDNKQSHTIVFFGTITSLRYSCFDDCTGLTNITIPLSVTSLGNYCFHDCTNLTSITLPNSITNLGDMCFAFCTGLASVTIPSSVTTLGDYCFYKCSSLNTYQLYWTGNNIITYDSNKMPNNTNTKFYVPQGQKTNYVNKGYPSAKVIERS